MEDNPAIHLYRGWQSLYELYARELYRTSLEELEALDDINGFASPSRRLGCMLQHIYRDFAIAPIGKDADEDPIFSLFRLGGWEKENLFILNKRGQFRLGPSFRNYQPRGAYDGVQRFTFMGTDRDYHARNRYDKRIWWVDTNNTKYHYLNTRDWKRHTLYWFEQDVPIETWFNLRLQGTSWVAEVARGQSEYPWLCTKVSDAYKRAENYYTKWRRTHYRRQGLPDPDRSLDRSEIETVNYIAQHINTYEPAKARIPTREEARLLGS